MRMSPVTLSIIIPAYNREHVITDTLEQSRQATAGLNAEWIVADDGSTDRTVEYSKAWAEKNPGLPVRITSQQNSGAAAARNNGLQLARGTYLLFLDSDDRLLGEWLPKAIDALEADPQLDICFTGYRIVDGSGNLIRTSQAFTEKQALTGILTTWVTHPDAIIYRRELIDRIGGFREDMPAMQDHEFTLRAFLEAGKVRRLRGYGVDVREEGGDRISASRFARSQPDVIRFLEETVHLLRRYELWQQYRNAWQARCESYIYQFLRHGRRKEARQVEEVRRKYAGSPKRGISRMLLVAWLPGRVGGYLYRKCSGYLK